ncbi:Nuclear control of ATPase protein 2 [Tulasnella sp. 419]|nr:Nuclear control of ATPase protein 2 [Tulasnella sp. 419]
MDVLLKQAAQAEDEAEWWGRIERVGGGTAWYFLQTFPIRFARLSNVLLNTVKSQTQTITLETFKPGSLHRIFPPNSFTHLCGQSLFPHLTHPTELFRRNPLEITRQESRLRRIELEKLRDRRAQSLGQLAAFRGAVEDALRSERPLSERMETLQVIVELLDYSLKDTQSPDIPPFNPREAMSSARASTRTLFPRLHEILTTRLMSQGSYHRAVITPLQKPSWIVRRWPRIILGPPLAFLAFKLVFKSKDQMLSTLKEAGETIVAFWKDWVVEPIAGILETVRTGGDTGMRVVSKEGLNSDMDLLSDM